MQLSEPEKQQAIEAINTGKQLPPELEKKLCPTIEFEKLKILFDYTKFHLGLYMTLVAAIIAFLTSELGPPLGSDPSLFFLGTVVFLVLAGACGGMVGATIPEHANLSKFLGTKIGFWKKKGSNCRRFVLRVRTWVHLEHVAFWLGITSMIIGLGFFASQRRNQTRYSEVREVLVTFADAWNKRDAGTMAGLWIEKGEWKARMEPTVHGRDEIEKKLVEWRQNAESPLALTNTDVRLVESNLAVVDGCAEFLKRDSSGSVSKLVEPFTAFLTKKKSGWAIYAWIWGSIGTGTTRTSCVPYRNQAQ